MRLAEKDELSLIHQRYFIAQHLNAIHVVTYKNNRFPAIAMLIELSQALILKREVTNSQYLIYEQNFRLAMDGNSESEPHKHSAGIVFHRDIDEIGNAALM
jgi:hypothetical protein